ncbi:endonuclease YncB(thermonuclease family) [Nitrobacteraceae bacterium AZCC 2161]
MNSLFLIALIAATGPAAAADVVGQASVIDGDTIEIHGTRIRLFGIDAPESDQTCHDDDGKLYRCGQKAANELSAFIGAKTTSCTPQSADRYGRTAAVCSAGGVDIADWLVRGGLAFDWPQYSKGKYAAAQRDAERTGDGMGGGQWVVPWRYRECVRAGGKAASCSESAVPR